MDFEWRSAIKPSRRTVVQLAAAAGLAALPRAATAQSYPSRPIHIVLGFPPGGSSDVIGRLMAQWLSERLRQPFVFDNRPGAGSNIGTELVARVSPTAIRCCGRPPRMPLTRPSTATSISTSSATSPRLQASFASPTSWRSIHRSRRPRFPSSSPTPGPIRASSTSPRAASDRRRISPPSSSSS